MKRILIAAGGTGGHFYPGISLAKTLRQKGWEALFIVRQDDPAKKTLEAEGFPYAEIPLQGMPRSLRGWGRFAFGLAASLRLSFNIVSDFNPDLIAGMGGYLSFPAILAATLKRKPRLVHESNVLLGLSNQICAFLGAKLLRGLPGEWGVLVGTPIRPSLWTPCDSATSKIALGLDLKIPTLLVFGGSQGARGVNLKVPEALKTLSEKFPNGFQVLHLSGNNSAIVESVYQSTPFKVEVKSYFESMEQAYGAADLVLCRAGASTVAELCAQKKPAILVPFPAATANHQFENARVLEKAGAAVILPEEKILECLPSLIESLLLSKDAKEKRESMQEAYSRLALPVPAEAISRFADIIENF
jgi:UDP-N-acetylglucosamine--N-acetylmuramyl-(pentapeptide) pyrophosphoryl-undecaprenol N-acetylglucosamine transferase